MEFPFPVLLCDTGGTNARFSLVRAKGARIEHGPNLKTHDFPAFEDALRAARSTLEAKPRSLIVCAAGPVDRRAVRLTNALWTIDGTEIAVKSGLDQGLLLNDFEAQAFSLPFIEPAWTRPIGPPVPPTPGTQLILGLGTGLGVAALLNLAGRFFALSSEAGHMDFGPLGEEEGAIWAHLGGGPLGRVSAETVLSGPGLLRLHLARCAAQGAATAIASDIALVEAALGRPDGEEAATLRLCWVLTARFAGDLVLAYLAKGGVTLAGGILPRIVEFCDPAAFRAAFKNKAPYGERLRGIGTRLIDAENTVFAGMAAIAARPQDFAIDYAFRLWR